MLCSVNAVSQTGMCRRPHAQQLAEPHCVWPATQHTADRCTQAHQPSHDFALSRPSLLLRHDRLLLSMPQWA